MLHLRRTSRSDKILIGVFLISLPLCNPWVRGDGVGYYAYARALLINYNLNFEKDYLAANPNFISAHSDSRGHLNPSIHTATGHLDNHFSIGPAILWAPFLITAHFAVLAARAVGSNVTADGFSTPYLMAMAFGTAFYGFIGLWISFQFAKTLCEERWALLATMGVWWGTSLPVYMYFNPSWSHAHSAFSVALFLWYWNRTRKARDTSQWIALGWLAALMINIYYVNAMLLAVPGLEALLAYRGSVLRRSSPPAPAHLFGRHVVFCLVTLVGLAPTFITRAIIFGNPLETGYTHFRDFLWRTPAWGPVLFSADHGLFVWTPLVFLSVVGLLLLLRGDVELGAALLAGVIAFYVFISFYPNWDGMSSFGNRFFVSLTILFVLGLAVMLQRMATTFAGIRFVPVGISLTVALAILWNLGFIFQWGTHLVPVRGPVSWREMIHNQVSVVPAKLAGSLYTYFFRRKIMMLNIEEKDAEQLQLQKLNTTH